MISTAIWLLATAGMIWLIAVRMAGAPWWQVVTAGFGIAPLSLAALFVGLLVEGLTVGLP